MMMRKRAHRRVSLFALVPVVQVAMVLYGCADAEHTSESSVSEAVTEAAVEERWRAGGIGADEEIALVAPPRGAAFGPNGLRAVVDGAARILLLNGEGRLVRTIGRSGQGPGEFAQVVIEAAEEKPHFKLLYEDDEALKSKIEKIATQVYGADGVSYSPVAEQKIKKVEADEELKTLGTCMVKTHLSLSHDPNVKGRPKGWTLPISDVLTFRGAGFVVPVAGDIKLMPGTASDAAYRRIDVNPETGKVVGLF